MAQMKKLYLLLVALSITSSVFAQTTPTLPILWKGTDTNTAFGAPSKHHPLYEGTVGKEGAAKGWNTLAEPRELIIIKQVGRHIEAIFKSTRSEAKFVGTISLDGKQLQLVSPVASINLAIIGNKELSGCGSARGGKGDFDHSMKNYAAICWDLKADK